MTDFGHERRADFVASPVVSLNHGTVGVAPLRVLHQLAATHREIESDPAALLEDFHARLCGALEPLAAGLGAPAEQCVFVDNTTVGVNAVLAGFPLEAGDEILVTAHTYPGIRHAVLAACARTGAVPVQVALPFPVTEGFDPVRMYEAAVTLRTRLAIVDHITSGTGFVMPVDDIVAQLLEQGVPTLVDAAHAYGQVDVDLGRTEAAFTVGNLHKWAYAPRSTAVLHVDPEWTDAVQHPVTSLYSATGPSIRPVDWREALHWPGTRDLAPWLAAPAGWAYLASLGLEEARAWQRVTAADMEARLCEAWGETPSAPRNFRAAMFAVRVPADVPFSATAEGARALRRHLRDVHRLEVAVFPHEGRLWLRLSAAVYTEPDDVQPLIEGVYG